jgi:hypothetical protein
MTKRPYRMLRKEEFQQFIYRKRFCGMIFIHCYIHEQMPQFRLLDRLVCLFLKINVFLLSKLHKPKPLQDFYEGLRRQSQFNLDVKDQADYESNKQRNLNKSKCFLNFLSFLIYLKVYLSMH